jgi:hypothetical protein
MLELTTRDRWIARSSETVENIDDFARLAIEKLYEQVRRRGKASIA